MVNNVNLFIPLNVAGKSNIHNKKSIFLKSLFSHFPNCAYGSECLYIHPPCRFGSTCARPDCPYLHSSSTPASSPNNNSTTNTGRSSISNRAESSTVSSTKKRFRIQFLFYIRYVNMVCNVCVQIVCILILVCRFHQLGITNG
jgi:hypothetical protein